MTALAVLSADRLSGGASSLSFHSVRNNTPETDRCAIGNNSRAICDPYAIRRKHPEHWIAFIRAHFPDVMTVHLTFGVDYATAKHWWLGTGAAQGWAVEFALKSIPDAASWLVAA